MSIVLTYSRETDSMQDISYTVHTFKEGGTYVAYVPELDLSSCGATTDDAQRSIREAVQGFLETTAAMGTLDEILEEASALEGHPDNAAPEFVAIGREKARVA